MSLLKALKGANPAGKAEGREPVGDGLAERGYTVEPYVTDHLPLRFNSESSNFVGSVGNLGNDGTSAEAYHMQPLTVSSENPDVKKEGKA